MGNANFLHFFVFKPQLVSFCQCSTHSTVEEKVIFENINVGTSNSCSNLFVMSFIDRKPSKMYTYSLHFLSYKNLRRDSIVEVDHERMPKIYKSSRISCIPRRKRL